MSMKTLKKLLLLVMTLAVLVGTVFAVSAFAEDTEATTPEDSGAGESTVEPTVLYVNSTGDPLEDGTTGYLWNDALQYVNDHAAEGAFKIVLLENVTVDATFTFTVSVNLTIDLAGTTLTTNIPTYEDGAIVDYTGDAIFLGDNSSNSIFTLITSTAGGIVDAKGSLFTITGKSYDADSLYTFNFGCEGSEALTMTAQMYVEGATAAFKEDMTANINIDGGDYKFTYAFYQVSGSESTVSATFHVNAKNAAIRGKGQFVVQNSNTSLEKQNPASTISFTNCTLAYSSTSSPSTRAVPFSNSYYMGSISMTRCEIQAFVFNEKVSKAKSIELSEGCKFNGSYTKAMTTTLNEDKTAFNQTNVSIPDGCYLYQSKGGSVCVLNNERVLQVSNETNYEAGTYTWNDALSFVNSYYNETDVLTVQLTEDLSVSSQYSFKKPVKLTIDLAGYTLSATKESPLKMLDGSAGTILTIKTSKAGGTWDNTVSSNQSVISLGANSTPYTFNFGGADSEPLTVKANMLFNNSYLFNGTDGTNTAYINLGEGTYTLGNGIYQMQASLKGGTVGATFHVNAVNATISGTSRLLVYRNNSNYGLNPNSTACFTDCTLIGNSSKTALAFSNTYYKGSIQMTRCTVKNIVLDWTISNASVAIGEGCVFTTPDVSTQGSSGTVYTTFNDDKTGFAFEHISWPSEECSIFLGKSGSAYILNKKLEFPINQNGNKKLGIYTWNDAFELLKELHDAGAFTIVLTEDIAITTGIELENKVVLTIDLAGYTLNQQTKQYADAIKVKGSNTDITIMTSVEGGTWQATTNSGTSPFGITAGASLVTFNFGTKNSAPLIVESAMLVEASALAFCDKDTAQINLYGGSYTLATGFYQVEVDQNDSGSRTSAPIFAVVAENATISVNGSLFYVHSKKETKVPLNENSFMHFTGCEIIGRSKKGAGISSADQYHYLGTITMTGCHVENFVFDKRAQDATDIVLTNCTIDESVKYSTGIVAANDNDGSIHIMLGTKACLVNFKTPNGTEESYWIVGSTPVYKGAQTATINGNEYTITFPTLGEVTTAGETYEYPCQLTDDSLVIKTSLTLYSGIDLNVYIPVRGEIKMINDKSAKEYSTLKNGGVEYYKVPITLAPKDAGNTQTVTITISFDEQTEYAFGARTVSVVDYVDKLADNYDGITEELALALLAYVKAARLYFYRIDAEEGDEVTKAIDAVLAEHEYSVTEWTAEGKTIHSTAGLTTIKAAALDLGNTPGFAVAVAKNVTKVVAGGITYTVDPDMVVPIHGESYPYIVARFGAFSMIDDFTIVAYSETMVDGETVITSEELTFNLDTYLNGMGESASSYASALYGYAAAAKAYLEQ